MTVQKLSKYFVNFFNLFILLMCRRELDQFLKLRKLSLSELRFQEINSVAPEDVAKYPRYDR